MRDVAFRRVPVALFSLPDLAAFCAPGYPLHRAFDHVIAARRGSVLLAPVGKVGGDLTTLRDGCPLPWAEVWAVLDRPIEGRLLEAPSLIAIAPQVAQVFSPYGWQRDWVDGAIRLSHDNGLRFAFVPVV